MDATPLALPYFFTAFHSCTLEPEQLPPWDMHFMHQMQCYQIEFVISHCGT